MYDQQTVRGTANAINVTGWIGEVRGCKRRKQGVLEEVVVSFEVE